MNIIKVICFFFSTTTVGESASILIEQRQKEYISQSKDQELVGGNDDKNGEFNHDGLLQINERQFYDNLLVCAYCKYVLICR